MENQEAFDSQRIGAENSTNFDRLKHLLSFNMKCFPTLIIYVKFHKFYTDSLVNIQFPQLHFGPVIAIFTSTLIGCGTAISINALVLEFFSLRSRLRQGLVHPHSGVRDAQNDEMLRSTAETHGGGAQPTQYPATQGHENFPS